MFDKGAAEERSHVLRTGYEIASTFPKFRVRETRYFRCAHSFILQCCSWFSTRKNHFRILWWFNWVNIRFIFLRRRRFSIYATAFCFSAFGIGSNSSHLRAERMLLPNEWTANKRKIEKKSQSKNRSAYAFHLNGFEFMVLPPLPYALPVLIQFLSTRSVLINARTLHAYRIEQTCRVEHVRLY